MYRTIERESDIGLIIKEIYLMLILREFKKNKKQKVYNILMFR